MGTVANLTIRLYMTLAELFMSDDFKSEGKW